MLHVAQGSSILEFVEIDMSMFDSHVLQEVGTVGSRRWATCSNVKDRTSEHHPFIEHGDTTHAHAYLDTAISI